MGRMVPEITPVAGSMSRPGGRAVADQDRASPSGSEPITGSDTTVPSASVRFAGAVTTGARLVLVIVQVNESVANRPPGSCTRTTTA